MKKLFDLLARILMWSCEKCHELPEKQDEALQVLFYNTIGYTCPFATWAFYIDEHYGYDKWRVRK